MSVKSLEWLAHHDFYTRTGVTPGRVRFSRERPDKAAVAAEPGPTHFIDDRLEVLGHLETVGNLFPFRPQAGEMRRHRRHLHRVVQAWDEAAEAILAP
jgi:hypothetical protein